MRVVQSATQKGTSIKTTISKTEILLYVPLSRVDRVTAIIAKWPIQVAVPFNLKSNNTSLEWRMGNYTTVSS